MLQQGLAFKGFSIEASDGRIGTVSDFLFDDTTWKLRWLVVDTSFWLTACKILVHPSAIERADVPAKALLVKLTRDQVEKSPRIATDEPVSLQMEASLYGYYGVNPMWGGAYYDGNAFDRPLGAPGLHAATPDDGGRKKGDPHLRSLDEVAGYRLRATDGVIGHVESFLIDDENWDIRYLVADTRNWWFGRHVLLSPASVQEIRWGEHQVSLNLTCYKIKGSPAWDATGMLDRAYETLVQAYYGWPDRFLPTRHTVDAKAPAKAAAHVEAA